MKLYWPYSILLTLVIILISIPAPEVQANPRCLPCVKQVTVVQAVNTTVIQPIVLQEILAPAFVFQVLTPFQGGQVQPIPDQQPAPEDQSQTGDEAMEERIANRVLSKIQPVGSTSLPIIRDGSTPVTGTNTLIPRTAKLDPQAVSYLKNTCASCHQQGVQTKGDVSLFNSRGEWSPTRTNGKKLRQSLIMEVCREGEMPPAAVSNKAKRVPANIVESLRQWALRP